MPKFGESSMKNLNTCDPKLRRVFREVVKHFDCSVIQGVRDEETQNAYYEAKRSKVKYPHSKHNAFPSQAVDVAPYPINWEDYNRLYFFAGVVMGTAQRLGIKLRWGGDWDGDTEVNDQSFNDLVHFELVE